jgi:arginase family enzyme
MAGVVPGFEWLQDVPVLNTDRLVYIGLRDVDAGEKEILRAKNIKHYTAEDVARLGIKTVMDEVTPLRLYIRIYKLAYFAGFAGNCVYQRVASTHKL